MIKAHYARHSEDGRGSGEPGTVKEFSDMGQRTAQWHATLRSQYPEVLAHLVWDRDRLDRLNSAVESVLRADPQVTPSMVPLYQRSLVNQLTGLEPLDGVLLDEKVTEIMVNGTTTFCEVEGRIIRWELGFKDKDEVALLARRLANRAGRELNTEHPLCDAQLSDGSRIHCVLPPVAETPTITIRRAPRTPLRREDYLGMRTFSEALWADLVWWVQARKNILVAGGAGSGKTSLLRLLATVIPPEERLITIEDVRELNLTHPHVVSLEARRQQTVHMLLINALRMRPDRIIVGEVRGAEALELLEAMSTGHPGSLSTIHSAGGGMQTVNRLIRMSMQTALGIPYEALLDQIMETIDVIVYMVRDRSGYRHIDAVSKVGPEGIVPVWQYRPGHSDPFVRVAD